MQGKEGNKWDNYEIYFFTDGLNKKVFPKLSFILYSYCSDSLSFVHYFVKPEQNHAYHKFTGQIYI